MKRLDEITICKLREELYLVNKLGAYDKLCVWCVKHKVIYNGDKWVVDTHSISTFDELWNVFSADITNTRKIRKMGRKLRYKE